MEPMVPPLDPQLWKQLGQSCKVWWSRQSVLSLSQRKHAMDRQSPCKPRQSWCTVHCEIVWFVRTCSTALLNLWMHDRFHTESICHNVTIEVQVKLSTFQWSDSASLNSLPLFMWRVWDIRTSIYHIMQLYCHIAVSFNWSHKPYSFV